MNERRFRQLNILTIIAVAVGIGMMLFFAFVVSDGGNQKISFRTPKKLDDTWVLYRQGESDEQIIDLPTKLKAKKGEIITVKPGTGGAELALPPEKIDLYRICSVVDPEAIDKMIGIHGSPSPFCPVGRNIDNVLGKTYDTLKNNLIASMKTITLEQILADYHEVLAEEKNKKS